MHSSGALDLVSDKTHSVRGSELGDAQFKGTV